MQVVSEEGTARHRLCDCVGHSDIRNECCRILQPMGEVAEEDDLLWTRGLVLDPVATRQVREVREVTYEERWAETEEDACDGQCFHQAMFTNGSLVGKFRKAGQAGWAAVSSTLGKLKPHLV